MKLRLIMLFGVCCFVGRLYTFIEPIIDPAIDLFLQKEALDGNGLAFSALIRLDEVKRKIAQNPAYADIIATAHERKPKRTAHIDRDLAAAHDAILNDDADAAEKTIAAASRSIEFAHHAMRAHNPIRAYHNPNRVPTFPAYACALAQRLFSGL